MKLLVFLCFFLFTLCSFYTATAQNEPGEVGLKILNLDTKYENLVDKPELDLSHGDTIIFISKNYDFGLIIRNAKDFLEIDDTHLTVRANSYLEPEIYIVKEEPIKGEYMYEIYCITKNKWADAPPRIIIHVD